MDRKWEHQEYITRWSITKNWLKFVFDLGAFLRRFNYILLPKT